MSAKRDGATRGQLLAGRRPIAIIGGPLARRRHLLTRYGISVTIRMIGYHRVLDVPPADPVRAEQDERLPLVSCPRERKQTEPINGTRSSHDRVTRRLTLQLDDLFVRDHVHLVEDGVVFRHVLVFVLFLLLREEQAVHCAKNRGPGVRRASRRSANEARADIDPAGC